MRNNIGELKILKNIRRQQQLLKQELISYKITSASDLQTSRIGYAARRGLVQMVGDIFELTKNLKDATINKINFSRIIIREFRNTASHNYGVLTNEFALGCIKHCISNELIQSIDNEIVRLEKEMRVEE
ncbi:MAG: hypothetical protein FWH10_03545 [Oscillospiraceae bacterium]|nr:hypothetical protein [Oscillospiraceae bacterium]